MNPTDVDLDSCLKRLHLANARRVWRELIVRAETEQWSFHHFLAVLVSEEVAQRQQTRLARLSRRAEFPFLKTIDEFDFTFQSTLRLALLGSALSPDFVTEGRCLILQGKPGRGKTHVAVAIAYRAIQNGFDALFVTAAELIDDLSAAFRQGQLAEALARYTHPHLLVVDEVGYLTYGTDAANMLFHVVNDRHKRKRSMIFTTNKQLKAWGAVLHDEDLAHAIVDRILERGRILHLDGPSMRTRHLGLDDDTPQALSTQMGRISGIGRAEFPEPTELTSLCRKSIILDTGAHIRVVGKGRKERSTPLTKRTASVLRAWLREIPSHDEAIVFPNARGSRLSEDGVQYLLSKHVANASEACPSLKSKHVTPHVLRHTTAMELLQAGVDRAVIALWLGHESLETTQIYLDANLALKEAALGKIAFANATPGRYRPDDQLMAFLKAL